MLGGGSNLLIGDLIELQFLGNSYNLNLGCCYEPGADGHCPALHELHFELRRVRDGRSDVTWRKNIPRCCMRTYVILVFCFMYLPIAVMIAFSFNESKSRSNFTGFTLGWYKSLFHNEMILSALGLSLVLALVSSVIATVLGTLATIGINSMSRRSQLIINNISYVPVVNPEIITGVSLMLLFVMCSRASVSAACRAASSAGPRC